MYKKQNRSRFVNEKDIERSETRPIGSVSLSSNKNLIETGASFSTDHSAGSEIVSEQRSITERSLESEVEFCKRLSTKLRKRRSIERPPFEFRKFIGGRFA